MNLLKYFPMYYRLTDKKILVFVGLTFVSAFFEMITAGTLITVLKFGTNIQSNRITKFVDSLIDNFNFESPEQKLGALLLFAVVTLIAGSVFEIFSRIYIANIETSTFVKIEMDIVKKLTNADYQYFLSHDQGTLSNTLLRELRGVSISFRMYGMILVSIVFACLYISLPTIINPIIVLIVMSLGIPFYFLNRLINRKISALSVDSRILMSKFSGLVIQYINFYKYLKSTETYPPVLGNIKGLCGRIGHNSKMMAFWGSFVSYALMPIAFAASAGIIYFQIVAMKVHLIDALTVLGLLYIACNRLLTIPGSYQKFLNFAGSIFIYEEISEELSRAQERKHSPNCQKPDFTGNLVFKDVWFKYGKGKHYILKGINIEISPGSCVAFVGGSGAGKSTIINMLTGLLKPVKGEVSISSCNYENTDIRSLRAQIGYVTQEPVIFNDSIRNNLTMFGTSDAADIDKYAKLTHSYDFINNTPQRYDSLLGDNGVNISGGQRQRISLTREIARNTKILILDEATSSLDSETEKVIFDNMNEIRKDKTVIIIAHRLSTVKNCDIIFVLDKGEIVEHGTYSELYNRSGRFRQMVDSQSLN